MSNTGRGVYEEKTYEFFDDLPKSIRIALANAEYNWVVEPIHSYYRCTNSIAKTVAIIVQDDVDKHQEIADRERRPIFTSGGRMIHPTGKRRRRA